MALLIPWGRRATTGGPSPMEATGRAVMPGQYATGTAGLSTCAHTAQIAARLALKFRFLIWPQSSYGLPYCLLLPREAWENEGWRTGALPYLSQRPDPRSYAARSTRIRVANLALPEVRYHASLDGQEASIAAKRVQTCQQASQAQNPRAVLEEKIAARRAYWRQRHPPSGLAATWSRR
jgi:hypothetical protein